MPARTGAEYIAGLRENPPALSMQGEVVLLNELYNKEPMTTWVRAFLEEA